MGDSKERRDVKIENIKVMLFRFLTEENHNFTWTETVRDLHFRNCTWPPQAYKIRRKSRKTYETFAQNLASDSRKMKHIMFLLV